jgi:hypothetical protein
MHFAQKRVPSQPGSITRRFHHNRVYQKRGSITGLQVLECEKLVDFIEKGDIRTRAHGRHPLHSLAILLSNAS